MMMMMMKSVRQSSHDDGDEIKKQINKRK